MLGLLTTVVLFLRLRRTSLWKTWELSLQREQPCHASARLNIKLHRALLILYYNLNPFIMGALLDLLKCPPSLCTNEDGISRSSSIFSWGNTPELFMLLNFIATNHPTLNTAKAKTHSV